MATNYCPTLSADPAVIFADGGYSVFMDLAPKTFQEALTLATQLGSLNMRPIDFNVGFNFDGQLTPFQRPPRPNINAGDFDFHTPAAPPAPPTYTPGMVSLDPAPVFDGVTPNIQIRPAPSDPLIDAPQPPQNVRDLVIPDAPSYALPPLPTLDALNLPSAPSIQLPTFTNDRPIFVEPPLNENWSFNPQAYSSDLLEKVKAKVTMMMDGGLGLEPIEQIMFNRGRARLDIEMRRTIDTRTAEFSARGFSEPNGILNAAVLEIMQGGLEAKAELNSNITIESYKELIQNVRLGVQNGIALEQVSTDLHIKEQQLALQAAQFLRESSIAILNARVSVFNAKIQAYQTDAQVFETRIRAELAKVEVYRAQIEGERARGEINEQRVRIYSEQVRSIGVMADFYRTQVQAVQAQADVERSKIESFKAMVDAYSARWRAYGEQVDAYKAGIDAENSKATVHRNLVDAYATRVQAWGTTQGNRIALERLGIDQSGQKLAAWRGQLDQMLALVQAESARIGAQGQRADALARVYTADAGVESAASAASDRTFQLGVEREQANVQTQLRNVELLIQQNMSLIQQLTEVRRVQAQVMGQLAASSMSAMNFSASVSSARSQSTSCAQSVSWTGEAPDL